MNTSIVLTVVSDDHPGIVEQLSNILVAHGGNWTESSMMSLAGKFAGILLAHVPEENADAFIGAMGALRAGGIEVVAQCSSAEPSGDLDQHVSIELVGQDRSGIVQEITAVLARHGVNVHELETTVQSASMSGEILFLAHAKVSIPADADVDQLRDELEELANEMMVDISMVGAE